MIKSKSDRPAWGQTFVVTWVVCAAIGTGGWLFDWQKSINDIQQLDQQVVNKQQDFERIQEEIANQPAMQRTWSKEVAQWRSVTHHRRMATADVDFSQSLAAVATRLRLRVVRCEAVPSPAEPSPAEAGGDRGDDRTEAVPMPAFKTYEVVLSPGGGAGAAFTRAAADCELGRLATVEDVEFDGSATTVRMRVYPAPVSQP